MDGAVSKMMYSIADLEEARAKLRAVEEKWVRYSGNNPDKYHGERNAARDAVAYLEDCLKEAGILRRSTIEVLNRNLDAAFPDARHKDVVQFEGEYYERRFTPGTKSRSGNVLSWDKIWKHVVLDSLDQSECDK